MKRLIKKLLNEYLLKEEMVPYTQNYEKNISVFENTIVTLISKDNENNNKLYLFVGFQDVGNNLTEYYYSFRLYNDSTPISDFMNKRSEVSKYIPSIIKNKKIIFPIITDMTKRLLNNKLPERILRKTSEILDNDNSLKRYEIIGNILVNDYGYILEKSYEEHGIKYWLYKKSDLNSNNSMDENYLINSLPTWEDTNRMINRDFTPIFNEHLKKTL